MRSKESIFSTRGGVALPDLVSGGGLIITKLTPEESAAIRKKEDQEND